MRVVSIRGGGGRRGRGGGGGGGGGGGRGGEEGGRRRGGEGGGDDDEEKSHRECHLTALGIVDAAAVGAQAENELLDRGRREAREAGKRPELLLIQGDVAVALELLQVSHGLLGARPRGGGHGVLELLPRGGPPRRSQIAEVGLLVQGRPVPHLHICHARGPTRSTRKAGRGERRC